VAKDASDTLEGSALPDGGGSVSIPSGFVLRADAVEFLPALKLRPENPYIPKGTYMLIMLEVYGENGATALADTVVPGEATISKLNRWQRPLAIFLLSKCVFPAYLNSMVV